MSAPPDRDLPRPDGLARRLRPLQVGAGMQGFMLWIYDTVIEETGSADAYERWIGRVRVVESAAFTTSALFGGGDAPCHLKMTATEASRRA